MRSGRGVAKKYHEKLLKYRLDPFLSNPFFLELLGKGHRYIIGLAAILPVALPWICMR